MNLYIIDTDTLTLYQKNHPAVCRKIATIPASQRAISVISVEEQLSGWYSSLRRAKDDDDLAFAYLKLTIVAQSLAKLQIFTFDKSSIARYDRLKAMKLNVRKPDLRIAAIALEKNAIVVTRNTRDFQRIPGLQVEDWSK